MAKEITVDAREIRNRLDFPGFTDSDAELLRSMKPWAGKAIPEFVKVFYDYQFRDPDFSETSAPTASPGTALRPRRPVYARTLFDGCLDMTSVNRRIAIGRLHARINITPRWCFTNAEKAISAVNKLFNLDQALIMDTRINGLMDQMRGLVTQAASTAGNLAEARGQLSTTAEQAGQAVQGIASTSQEVARTSEEQSAKSSEVTNGISHRQPGFQRNPGGCPQRPVRIRRLPAGQRGSHRRQRDG